MFAHNAKYDVQVTQAIPALVARGYVVKGYSDSNPHFIRLEKKSETRNGKEQTSKITILSSTNYYQKSLAQLGKDFNLPKLDFDHDTKVDMSDPKFVIDCLTYGVRDVDILEAAMLAFLAFIEREELGKFSMTVAGQSFAAFQSRFMLHDIHIHNDETAIPVERRAYAGGRNECFQIGKIDGQVYYLDINSMYPYVMKAFRYPTKLVTVWQSCSVDKMMNSIGEGMLVCADVVVNVDTPIFHKKDDRLIFPVGEFETTLSTPEIIEAHKRGFLVSCKNVCIYEGYDIFSAYVDFFYENRLLAKHDGDSVHDTLFKIFMNSLYGKFGQKDVEWFVLTDEDNNEIEIDPTIIYQEQIVNTEHDEVLTRKMLGGRIFEKSSEGVDRESFNSFPAVAAHVTSHARMLLWTFIEGAGLENVYYCDTDSVFVNETGYRILLEKGLIDPDRLGALKIEHESDDLELFGCKDYTFAGETKMKGVSKNAKALGHNEHGQLQFAVTQWGGFADRFKEQDFTTFYNKVIIKTLKREYTKGYVCQDTGRVKPFVLSLSDEKKEKAKKNHKLRESDSLRYLCELHGFIKMPLPGEDYHDEYSLLPMTTKGRYFRLDKCKSISEWCSENAIGVTYLFQQLNRK